MHKVDTRLSQRIAEEAQLLAEEKWIIDALRKLKQQRNSLQIERLHIENLKATINRKDLRNLISTTTTMTETNSELTNPPPVSVNEQQQQPAPVEETPSLSVTRLSQFDVPVAGIDDEMCNNEILDLSVTNSVFDKRLRKGYDIEEDEEDLENENMRGRIDFEEDLYEDDMDNCLIEMNMLMQPNLSEEKGQTED